MVRQPKIGRRWKPALRYCVQKTKGDTWSYEWTLVVSFDRPLCKVPEGWGGYYHLLTTNRYAIATHAVLDGDKGILRELVETLTRSSYARNIELSARPSSLRYPGIMYCKNYPFEIEMGVRREDWPQIGRIFRRVLGRHFQLIQVNNAGRTPSEQEAYDEQHPPLF